MIAHIATLPVSLRVARVELEKFEDEREVKPHMSGRRDVRVAATTRMNQTIAFHEESHNA
jgi:hypothetical protein